MLILKNVRKKYGATVAVDDLSLIVRPGEVLGLLGPNGAGKSTTVNLAVGLLAPDRGSVSIEGAGDPRRAAAGAVMSFQMERPTLEQVFLHLTGRSLRD